MGRQLLALFLIVGVLCSAPVCAQQSSTPSEQRQTELRAKAVALLESLAGELGTLQSAENRARIGSNIAGSLWQHNENRARELFALVQQDISANLQVVQHPNPQTNHTILVFMNLRSDTIQRIAKYDPELAHSFFKATAVDSERLPITVQNRERELELLLARRIAATNPDIAVELGLKSASYDFPDDLRVIIGQLNRKHKDQAATLYKGLVRKLRARDLGSDWNARNFAVSLINSSAPPAVDDSSFRELAGIFIKLATDFRCAQKTVAEADYDTQQVCTAVGMASPPIAKVDPVRAMRLKHWAPNVIDSFEAQPTAYHELNLAGRDGTVEDILAVAAKYPEIKNEALFRAAFKARNEGDYERARKLISEFESATNRQTGLLNQIEKAQGKLRLDEEKLAAERKRIAELPQIVDRIATTITVAYSISVSDRANALKLLDEAREMLDTMTPGKDQTLMQISLASFYAAEGNERGLKMMEALVPKLNELVEGAVKLDGYDTRYLRDGEWNMSAEGPLGNLLTKLANNAHYFAWYDFDRAVEVAGQFQRPEIRMMAQLKLAQGILAGPPKPGAAGISLR